MEIKERKNLYVVNEKILFVNGEDDEQLEFREFVVDYIWATFDDDDDILDSDTLEGNVYDCGTYDDVVDVYGDPFEVDFIETEVFDTLEEAKDYVDRQDVGLIE